MTARSPRSHANANRLVRALRARGVQAGDGLALLCSNRPEFAETVVAVRASRAAAHDDQLASHRRRGRLHRRRLRRDRVRRRRALRRRGGRRRRARTAACRRASRSAARSTASRRGTTCSRRRRGAAIDDPQRRRARCSTRRARPVVRRACARRAPTRAPISTSACSRSTTPIAHVHLLTGPLYHAAPLAFSWSAPAALGVPIVMMDGWSAEADAAAHRAARHHAHAHGPDDVPPVAVAARRREGAYDLSSLIFILHGAAPCPVEVKQQLMDWLGPIVWEYYAATEGSGTLVSPHAVVAPAGHGREGRPARPRPHPRRRRRRRRPRRDRHRLPEGARTGGTRFEYYKAPEKTAGAYRTATTSRSATSATSTPTATSSSPTAARTSSSAAA